MPTMVGVSPPSSLALALGSGVPCFIYSKVAYATSKNFLSAPFYLIHALPLLGDGLSYVEVCESRGYKWICGFKRGPEFRARSVRLRILGSQMESRCGPRATLQDTDDLTEAIRPR
jgi:hypothetical protein